MQSGARSTVPVLRPLLLLLLAGCASTPLAVRLEQALRHEEGAPSLEALDAEARGRPFAVDWQAVQRVCLARPNPSAVCQQAATWTYVPPAFDLASWHQKNEALAAQLEERAALDLKAVDAVPDELEDIRTGRRWSRPLNAEEQALVRRRAELDRRLVERLVRMWAKWPCWEDSFRLRISTVLARVPFGAELSAPLQASDAARSERCAAEAARGRAEREAQQQALRRALADAARPITEAELKDALRLDMARELRPRLQAMFDARLRAGDLDGAHDLVPLADAEFRSTLQEQLDRELEGRLAKIAATVVALGDRRPALVGVLREILAPTKVWRTLPISSESVSRLLRWEGRRGLGSIESCQLPSLSGHGLVLRGVRCHVKFLYHGTSSKTVTSTSTTDYRGGYDKNFRTYSVTTTTTTTTPGSSSEERIPLADVAPTVTVELPDEQLAIAVPPRKDLRNYEQTLPAELARAVQAAVGLRAHQYRWRAGQTTDREEALELRARACILDGNCDFVREEYRLPRYFPVQLPR